MITDSFDDQSREHTFPPEQTNVAKCDVVIVTFSNQIEEYVVDKFKATQFNEFSCVNGKTPIYTFEHNGKVFGFYKTLLGAPASAGILEDTHIMFDCNKYLVFGSAGTIDKDCYGKVVVPTYVYRDEGTSYHYAKPSDYIEIKNHEIVANFMKKHGIPHKVGKGWTIDALYRETQNNIEKRKKDGCLVVDMECSALQAVCDLRGIDLYYFFLSGDLLDAPEWDKEGLKEANHNFQNFEIALKLAEEL